MRNVSFLSRVSIGLLAAALLPVLIIGASALAWSEQVLFERAGNHVLSVARLQRDRVQGLLAQHRERAALLASGTPLRQRLDGYLRRGDPADRAAVQRIVDEALAAVPALEHIVVLDPAGALVASTDRGGQEPVASPGSRSGAADGDDPRVSLRLGADGAIDSRALATLALDGEHLGYLQLDMSGAGIVAALHEFQGPGDTGVTMLVRGSGVGDVTVAGPAAAGPGASVPPSTTAEGDAGFEEIVDHRGVPVIAATSDVPGLGWGVMTTIDRDEVIGSVRLAQAGALIALSVASAVVAVALFGVARAFRKPMQAMLDAATQVGRGNLATRVTLPERSEFAELARAFNVMIDNLQLSRDQVDREIERRARLEERFRLIIESSPAAMILCDSGGRIALVNRVTERLFGYGREELMGQSIETLIPERYRASHPQHRESYCESPTPRAMGAGRALTGLRKDGSEVPIEIGLNPIKTDSGTMVLSAVIDLTERRRFETDLMEKNARLEREFWLKTGQTELAGRIHGEHEVNAVAQRALDFLCGYLDCGAGACYVMSPDGTLQLAAGHGLPASGVPHTVRIGHGLTGQAARDRTLRLIDNPPARRLNIESSLGAFVPASLAVVPLVYRDQVLGVLELASTSRFSDSHEELLTLASESIAIAVDGSLTARRMEDLLEESQRKSRELEQANDYKSSFLANMSHELRTPLNSLLILAQTLARNDGGRLSEDECKSAEIIESNGRNLLSLINDILDMSRIDAGKLHLDREPVALRDAVNGIAERFRPIATKAGHRFEVVVEDAVPESLRTDPQRLDQILTNLLSNASKFTSRGMISLRVSPGPEPAPGDPRRVLFAVTDSGIGIEPARQREIFDAFVQADVSRTRSHGGTGLGLSICRQLAELLGGEIAVRSRPGEGSTFTLILPDDGQASAVGTSAVRSVPESERSGAVRAAPAVRENVVLLDQDMRRAFAAAGRLADGGVAARIAPTLARVGTALEDMARCDAILIREPFAGPDRAGMLARLRDSSARVARIPVFFIRAGTGTDDPAAQDGPDAELLLEPEFTVDDLRRVLAARPFARSSAA